MYMKLKSRFSEHKPLIHT